MIKIRLLTLSPKLWAAFLFTHAPVFDDSFKETDFCYMFLWKFKHSQLSIFTSTYFGIGTDRFYFCTHFDQNTSSFHIISYSACTICCGGMTPQFSSTTNQQYRRWNEGVMFFPLVYPHYTMERDSLLMKPSSPSVNPSPHLIAGRQNIIFSNTYTSVYCRKVQKWKRK